MHPHTCITNYWNFHIHVQSMIHVSKMFAQLDGVTITDFESLLTPRGTFLASLVTSYEIVLEKWSKMCPTIRGQDDHLRFQIPLRSNNTALGPLEKHFWQVWWLIKHAAVLEKKSKMCLPIRGQGSHQFRIAPKKIQHFHRTTRVTGDWACSGSEVKYLRHMDWRTDRHFSIRNVQQSL